MAALYRPDALQETLLTAWRCNWQHDDSKLVRRLLLALPPGPAAQAPVSVHGGKHLHVPPLPEPVSAQIQPVQVAEPEERFGHGSPGVWEKVGIAAPEPQHAHQLGPNDALDNE